jgi:hypothetical protein
MPSDRGLPQPAPASTHGSCGATSPLTPTRTRHATRATREAKVPDARSTSSASSRFPPRNTKSARAARPNPRARNGSRVFGAQRLSAACERENYGQNVAVQIHKLYRALSPCRRAASSDKRRMPARPLQVSLCDGGFRGQHGGFGRWTRSRWMWLRNARLRVPGQLTLPWCRVRRDCVGDHSPDAK